MIPPSMYKIYEMGLYETLYFMDRRLFHRMMYIFCNDYRPFK